MLQFSKSLALWLVAVGWIAAGIATPVSAQSWREKVGWDYLVDQFGAAVADGSNIEVSQVETPTNDGRYMPDTSNSQFNGKTFIDGSGTNTGVSNHATSVGQIYYGNVLSIARGVNMITVFDAEQWINDETGLSSGGDPLVQPFSVQNHSWIGNGNPNNVVTLALQRVDYMINRDNVNLVVGANNGSSNNTPQLMAHGYNSITVGRTDGSHSSTDTTFYGSGRMKPEIVAPHSFTSFSTPAVSGAASILRDEALGTDGAENEVVKAMLLAGATKKEFPGWSRSITRPIDMVFGVGELNIYNSYRILQGGQFEGSSSQPAFDSGLLGWDFGTINGTSQLYYTLQLDEPADEVSIILSWNIDVVDINGNANIFTPSSSLSNLDLAFYDSNNSFPGNALDFSVSGVDNIEHIYLRDVAPGKYTILVASGDETPFALAWRVSPRVDTPATDLNVIRGVQFSGSVADVAASDDTYLKFRPGVTINSSEPPVWLEFEAVAPTGHPLGIRFKAETNASTSNIQQEVELYNFVDGIYESVDTRISSIINDSIVEIDLEGGEISRFVKPNTGIVRAKMSWKSVGLVFHYPWTISIDQVIWQIAE